MKMLLVEDHAELARSITGYQGQEHYICEAAGTFDGARKKLALFSHDVVLLDIMLPDGIGGCARKDWRAASSLFRPKARSILLALG
jgi:DNA-binding response OmpR family regulator